jgi:hypothetical protein
MAEEKGDIWKDQEGRLWMLADSSIDAEIFETIGTPVYNGDRGLWYQQVALRAT